jgi:hypothetical protein
VQHLRHRARLGTVAVEARARGRERSRRLSGPASRPARIRRLAHPALLFVLVLLMARYFAEVEIQIEGADGWAHDLPTWRIERGWALDWFWGGRALTGYHSWVFAFMGLAFHLPLVFHGRWSWKLEARTLGCLAIFWVAEDVIWFLANPDWGWQRFDPAHIPWHHHWWLGLPSDYWILGVAGLLAFVWSFRGVADPERSGTRNRDPSIVGGVQQDP